MHFIKGEHVRAIAMSGKKRVQVQVSADRKERWDEYADETNRSLSNLVRLAVDREIEGSASGSGSGSLGEPTESTDPQVLTALGRIQQSIEGLEQRMRTIEQSAESEGPEYNFRRVLFELLPKAPDGEEVGPNGETVSLPPQSMGITPEELARRIGADAEEVSDAIERLSSEMTQVSGAVGEDGAYYWRLK